MFCDVKSHGGAGIEIPQVLTTTPLTHRTQTSTRCFGDLIAGPSVLWEARRTRVGVCLGEVASESARVTSPLEGNNEGNYHVECGFRQEML